VHVEPGSAPQRSSGITATREWREHLPELQVEWVSHEIGKFVRLLQLNNGSAYEQLFSPFSVYETPALAELREIARAMLSQQLFLHYAAFFRQQLQLFRGQHDKHGRHVLYLCRVALTGLHLAERGQLLADLRELAQFHERVAVLALLDELDANTDVRDPRPYMRELEALGEHLASCGNPARLPELVPHRDVAEDWLRRLRER
jgi:predicted nucleotidyltransferase